VRSTKRRLFILFSVLSAPAIFALACGGDDAAVNGGGDDASTGDATTSDSQPATSDAGDAQIDLDAGPYISASITVDSTSSLGHVGGDFVGLSYEKAHLLNGFFRGDNAALIAMVQLLGSSVLRVGGNTVDETVWQTFDAGPPVGDAAAPKVITQADVDGLAAFAKGAGWKVIYGVNMKTSDAPTAAAEATYAATALGTSLYGMEIGNEPDEYTTVASSPGAWTYTAFRNDWQAFEAAIHASVPDAPITGPASAAHEGTWTVPFAVDEKDKIDLLTQHYYVANGQADGSTIDFLLQPHPTLGTEVESLNAAATDSGIANGWRMAECNSFYNGGAPGVSDGYGTALWAIDFLFENAMNGSSGANFHGGGNGPGYTPIADDGGSVVGARPIFYGMLLFAKAGAGTVRATTGAPTSINFSAYAIGGSASTSIVLSNKDRTTGVHATVDAKTTITSASALRLAGPALGATSGVTLGGVAIGADGTFAPTPEPVSASGTTFTIDVPAASAVLVTIH
jgi:hypothetical protein